MLIKSQVHTIFMLVGPTECGKSTFAKEVLIPQLKHHDKSRNFIANVQYLSSDELRQDVLGYDYDKYDQVMMESSAQAFDLLFAKLKAVTSFPVNAEYVVVDTTGLSDEFRNQVLEVAKTNNYHVDVVLFDYKSLKEYYSSERSKKIISQHVNRIRRDVLPNLKRSAFTRVHKVKEKNFFDFTTNQANSDYVVEIENLGSYKDSILPSKYKYLIVGDIHECLDSFVDLLQTNGFSVENGKITSAPKNIDGRIILIGDWIDKSKGNYTKDIISFIHRNIEWFYLVKGNHENFVAKYLNGQIEDSQVNPSLIKDYFDSIEVLEKDEKLKDIFLSLVDISRECYRYIGHNQSSFYVTHAPTRNKFLGKMDANSLRNQRRFATVHGEDLEKQLAFLEEEAVGNHPYHIFGHVATKEVFRIKNKIGIDTGIVYGNKLTSVVIDSNRPFFKTIMAKEPMNDSSLPVIFKREHSFVKVDELDDFDRKRLNYVLRNKINFISGTMSPSDKDVETNDLESLKQGLEYFKQNGVEEVILQPKYMGSRCNIYLSQNLEECFASSRNGFKIEHIDLTEVFCSLQSKFGSYMKNNQLKTLVLDGELLPWMALGKGLIEKQFDVVEKALDSEITFLKQFGFEKSFEELVGRFNETDYKHDQVKSSKKDLSDKYGHATYNTFKCLMETLPTYVSLLEHEKAFDVFKEQLAIYGQEAEMEFKPFAILKMMKENGSEIVFNGKTSEMFKLISSDEFITLNLHDENVYETALAYFNELTTERKMEGVVIKPEILKEQVAPYMKVRNPKYLTIVYGYDYRFPHKYTKLMKQKSIRNKLKTSINEFKLGNQMLEVKIEDIQPTNNHYKQVVANMLFEANKEKAIDPRL